MLRLGYPFNVGTMEEEYAVSIHETGYTYPKKSGGY